jgi:hypothetical protein
MLAVPGNRSLTFIDTARNDRAGEPSFFDGDLRGVETNADRSRLIVFYDGKVAVYDDNGKGLAEQAVKSPVSWAFLR